jgi:hypothetical protein
VLSDSSISYSRERDITNAPGGEVFTITNYREGDKFLISAHLYSYIGFASTGLVVEVYKDDVLIGTATPDTTSTSTQ